MGRVTLIEDLESRTLFSRAVGIDVSSYQGTPNWSSVASAGVQFAYAKATQGNYYIDADFASNMANGTAAGVVMGAYDFADYTVNATTEANYFLATAQPYVSSGYLRPMLDVEIATSDSASQVSTWVNTWCNDIYSDTGVKPIIYTYISYASEYLNSSVTQWPLWMSNPNGQSAQTGNPNATSPWSSWVLWQYSTTSTVSGISGDVDMDVAAGDMTSYVIPQLVAGSTQFTSGEVVHVNAAGGLKAWNTYASNGTDVVEPNNTNGIIEGGPVFINGYNRWPIEYAGTSTITWSAGSYLVAGGVPAVSTFTASPNPVAGGAPATLTATISDPDSTVSKVSFYRESNGTSGLQTGSDGDTLVGTATSSSSGNWTVLASTSGLSGTVTFYAVPTDSSGVIGASASTTDLVTTGQVQNPGFETPSVGSGASGDYSYAPLGATWSFSGYAGISGNGSMFTSGNPNAPEGTQVAFLEYANSSITQNVSMSTGSYQLGFYAAQRANTQASAQNFEVLIDGAAVGQFRPTSSSYSFYSTGPFTVTAGNHTVEFLGLDTAGGDNTAFIDNVALNAAVALPSYVTASAGAAYSYNASTGALNLTSGTLTFTADAGSNPLVNLTASGTASKVIFNTSEHVLGLTLSNGAQATVLSLGAARTHSNHNVLVIGTLGAASDPTFSIDSSSKLDLTDNDLIVHTGSSDTGTADAQGYMETSELKAVEALAAEGRNVAAGGVYDGTWTGNGLTSSAAASVDSAANAGYEQNILAVEQNSDMFYGGYSKWTVGSFSESLGANDIIVKYTYNGDLNLDGAVDGNAATIFATFFDYGATSGDTYAEGDLNGDGKVNGNDATIFSTVYGNGLSGSGLAQL